MNQPTLTARPMLADFLCGQRPKIKFVKVKIWYMVFSSRHQSISGRKAQTMVVKELTHGEVKGGLHPSKVTKK